GIIVGKMETGPIVGAAARMISEVSGRVPQIAAQGELATNSPDDRANMVRIKIRNIFIFLGPIASVEPKIQGIATAVEDSAARIIPIPQLSILAWRAVGHKAFSTRYTEVVLFKEQTGTCMDP